MAAWAGCVSTMSAVLGVITAALSNLVSNVPAVLVLRPFVPGLPDPQPPGSCVAMASTLAGNLTILGSVANLIVVRAPAPASVEIGFWEHLKVRRAAHDPDDRRGRLLARAALSPAGTGRPRPDLSRHLDDVPHAVLAVSHHLARFLVLLEEVEGLAVIGPLHRAVVALDDAEVAHGLVGRASP